MQIARATLTNGVSSLPLATPASKNIQGRSTLRSMNRQTTSEVECKLLIRRFPRVIDAVRRAHEIYTKAMPLKKRRILDFLISNAMLDGKKACYTWKSPFHLMAEGAFSSRWRSLRDLNARPPA